MKIIYDPQVDILSILLSSKPASKSTTEQTGLIFDYDQNGNVVKLKIPNASMRVDNPQTVEYSVNLTKTDSSSADTGSGIRATDNLSSLSSLAPITLEQRRAFLKLPLEERRRLLAQQAGDLVDHYQQNTDWKEFIAGDIIDY
jgi:uncharacterized protein YuzE